MYVGLQGARITVKGCKGFGKDNLHGLQALQGSTRVVYRACKRFRLRALSLDEGSHGLVGTGFLWLYGVVDKARKKKLTTPQAKPLLELPAQKPFRTPKILKPYDPYGALIARRT